MSQLLNLDKYLFLFNLWAFEKLRFNKKNLIVLDDHIHKIK